MYLDVARHWNDSSNWTFVWLMMDVGVLTTPNSQESGFLLEDSVFGKLLSGDEDETLFYNMTNLYPERPETVNCV
ncbi:hypothetical protein CDAR_6221 [Caerostris darwini]|uniref:Uncharacterized protein n=1 Tax=Caerostris darwini TaxID=1538125 RepID=A0AAV4MX43_9ARAC|nr:hypothetical protein CDAR_6221 [Caerostris darwini]